jgi:hypothetical protein
MLIGTLVTWSNNRKLLTLRRRGCAASLQFRVMMTAPVEHFLEIVVDDFLCRILS